MRPDEIGEKIIDSIEENSVKGEVTLIAGIINATQKMLYWRCDFSQEINIGDHAIVENMNDFDLIKIIGIVKTNKKAVSRFSNTNYDNMKKVVTFYTRPIK